MDMESFFVLHRDLPREGPGEPQDVAWATEVAGTRGNCRVCDAGCGPGADTETLAALLPEARIDAFDLYPQFVAAAAARCARFGARVSARVGSMADLSGPYDLIWSAGAVYFLGVTEALARWRPALAEGGRVAFSEPVLLDAAENNRAVRDFWADYPAITDRAGIEARIRAAGYRVLGGRLIVGAAWEAYYLPQEARIAGLRASAVPEALEPVLREAEAEIANWRAAPDRIAYLLSVVAPA
ncbi:class I SAM-dependent methyltransferase [Tropicimonas sp.]|uniref:class I SAM-dependent methyltransferase n=1 Tax=Tropicimonas sp. TaxID=2067044 RepID=UPI003A877B79